MLTGDKKKDRSVCEPTIRGEIKKARAGNYDTNSCIFEFVDNALDAGADKIRIDIRERANSGCPHKFVISDNSTKGISQEALRTIFSWTYERHRQENDVGEYGTGFKTASVNLADKLTVLTTDKNGCYQAIADWQDMADENSWEPKVMEIGMDYFRDVHPFQKGTTFILEGLRNEMFPYVQEGTCNWLFQQMFHGLVYHYRYILYENPTLHITIKGIPDMTKKEICEINIREHDIFQKKADPFHETDETYESIMTVYQDPMHFFHIFFQHGKSKKWESVEFIEKRKNGNSVLKCHEILPKCFERFRLVDTLTLRSVHITDEQRSVLCMSLYPTCTVDIVRKGRVMARDMSFRSPRIEPLHYFVKHEVWYHSYAMNPLLGIQYNKQNHGVMRENNLRYTIEYLQQIHEREFYKAEKQKDVPPRHPPSTEPKEPTEPKRKHFSTSTKIQVLNMQECRDSIMDFVLKDGVLLLEYDHKNGESSHNAKDNCQALSVVTHAVKTRCPARFLEVEKEDVNKTQFIVDLLNCITRSKYFLDAWTSGDIHIRDVQQQLLILQEGLFCYRETSKK